MASLLAADRRNNQEKTLTMPAIQALYLLGSVPRASVSSSEAAIYVDNAAKKWQKVVHNEARTSRAIGDGAGVIGRITV